MASIVHLIGNKPSSSNNRERHFIKCWGAIIHEMHSEGKEQRPPLSEDDYLKKQTIILAVRVGRNIILQKVR